MKTLEGAAWLHALLLERAIKRGRKQAASSQGRAAKPAVGGRTGRRASSPERRGRGADRLQSWDPEACGTDPAEIDGWKRACEAWNAKAQPWDPDEDAEIEASMDEEGLRPSQVVDIGEPQGVFHRSLESYLRAHLPDFKADDLSELHVGARKISPGTCTETYNVVTHIYGFIIHYTDRMYSHIRNANNWAMIIAGDRNLSAARQHLRRLMTRLGHEITALPADEADQARAFLRTEPEAQAIFELLRPVRPTAQPNEDEEGAAPFPQLSDLQVAGVMQRGKERSWDTRRERGVPWRSDVFEYIRDNYVEWIPGLTSEHLKAADGVLWAQFMKRKSADGLPPWLDVPTEAEARMRRLPDAAHRLRREGLREFWREESAKRRALGLK
jgi:hypothetical protein